MNRFLAFALCASSLFVGCGVPVDVLRPYGSTLPTSSATAPSVAWSTDARAFRGMGAVRVKFDCPAGGSAGTVYGTDLYTDDSSVCTAGVHVGRITLTGGGPIVIEMRPGAAAYVDSRRFGIGSNAYGAYDGSFVVL